MSARVLLILLNSWGKEKMSIFLFFATSLIHSIIQEHKCKILFITWHLN